MTAMANFKRNVLLRNIQSFLMPSLSNGTSHILPQFTWHCGRRALCTVFPANLLNLYFKSCRQFKCLEKASSFSKSREAVMYHVHVHPQFEIEDALRNYATFFLFYLVFFFFRQALNVIYITKTWFKFGTKWLEFHEFHLNS